MGRVSIWRQWLIVAVGVILSPIFAPMTAGLAAWLLSHRLWLRLRAAPGPMEIAYPTLCAASSASTHTALDPPRGLAHPEVLVKEGPSRFRRGGVRNHWETIFF
jgi:hypothetical protein